MSMIYWVGPYQVGTEVLAINFVHSLLTGAGSSIAIVTINN